MNTHPNRNQSEISRSYSPNVLQRFALGGMLVLTIVTFIAANLHAVLWQSSKWLVSTVLPAVVVGLTNEERVDLSEAPLRRNTVLDEAARMKAEDMAKNEYFSHYAPDGTSPWYWFDKAGYTYAHAGENLAIHFTDSDEVVEAWMNSPKHRENIVNGNYTEIGVGTAQGEFEGYDTVYVVQLFGAPANSPRPTSPARVVTPVVAEVTAEPETVVAGVAQAEAVLSENDSIAVEEILVAEASTTDPSSATSTPSSTAVVPVTVAELSEDSVIIESMLIATSSGLAVATVFEEQSNDQSPPLFAIATKPHTLLQYAYTIFGVIVVCLLVTSILLEVRRKRFLQMAYGGGLLIIMVGLWYVHSILTTGAVIV